MPKIVNPFFLSFFLFSPPRKSLFVYADVFYYNTSFCHIPHNYLYVTDFSNPFNPLCSQRVPPQPQIPIPPLLKFSLFYVDSFALVPDPKKGDQSFSYNASYQNALSAIPSIGLSNCSLMKVLDRLRDRGPR